MLKRDHEKWIPAFGKDHAQFAKNRFWMSVPGPKRRLPQRSDMSGVDAVDGSSTGT